MPMVFFFFRKAGSCHLTKLHDVHAREVSRFSTDYHHLLFAVAQAYTLGGTPLLQSYASYTPLL